MGRVLKKANRPRAQPACFSRAKVTSFARVPDTALGELAESAAGDFSQYTKGLDSGLAERVDELPQNFRQLRMTGLESDRQSFEARRRNLPGCLRRRRRGRTGAEGALDVVHERAEQLP
jgi:hypothetical protein